MRRLTILIACFRPARISAVTRFKRLWTTHALWRGPHWELAVKRKYLLPIISLTAVIGAVSATGASLDEGHIDGNLDVNDVSGASPDDWKKHWAVENGFSLQLDTQGYHFPTAIAFVPHPGKEPKDPLYFVTELRGQLKVVTNDRTVHTFAQGFLNTQYRDSVPHGEGEYGLAGICLEPKRGYVFVTFAYQDGATIRNSMIRFTTNPGTFALKPQSQLAFTDVFAPYASGITHQIGGCQISHDKLYVSVGDGWNSPLGSQRLNSLQGKVIRMTFDGKPAPGNPFYKDDDIHKASNYVWAYGFRNPFGLNVIDDKVIVAENGVGSDRFMEIQRGKNYLWDGNDWSIAANADYVFLNSVGPAQMNYFKPTSPAFPNRYKDQFYVALSGGSPGIMRIPYDLKQDRMRGVPQYFLRYTKDGGYTDDAYYPVTGVAFGPDGLYFVPIPPYDDGKVLKIVYDPQNDSAVNLADLEAFEITHADDDGVQRLMTKKGCFGCHTLEGYSWRGGTAGPVLDRGDGPMIKRIEQRISTPEYLNSLRQLDARNETPFNEYKQARHDVATAKGVDRVRVWMKYHILEPRFDNPFSAMPNQGLTDAEAGAVTNFLLGEESKGFFQKLKDKLLRNEQRRLSTTFGGGVIIGLPLWLILAWLGRLMVRRRA